MKHIKEFLSYVRKINPSFLSASITFYLLFMIVPISSLIINIISILEIKGLNVYYSSNIISVIILLFSVIWISISFVNALNISTHIIYGTDKSKTTFKKWFKLFFLVFILIFLIIIVIVSALFLLYLLEIFIGIKAYTLLILIQFLLQFLIITLIISVIYKYVIPVHIKISRTFIMGLMTTIIWYILLFLYRIIIHNYFIASYSKLYGTLAPLLIAIFLLYIMVNISVYIILINYYIVKKYQVSN